jgi:hypothetical protein
MASRGASAFLEYYRGRLSIAANGKPRNDRRNLPEVRKQWPLLSVHQSRLRQANHVQRSRSSVKGKGLRPAGLAFVTGLLCGLALVGAVLLIKRVTVAGTFANTAGTLILLERTFRRQLTATQGTAEGSETRGRRDPRPGGRGSEQASLWRARHRTGRRARVRARSTAPTITRSTAFTPQAPTPCSRTARSTSCQPV